MESQEHSVIAVARAAIRRAIDNNFPHVAYKWSHLERATDAALEYLAVAGYTIAGPGQYVVDADDLEMAVEWMDQADNPWSGSDETREAWVASLIARDHLKDVIAAIDTNAVQEQEAQPDMVSVERSVLVTIDEALDIIDNPYHGESELEAWADFYNAKDMLDLALYPTGKTADWLGLVPDAEEEV